MRKRAICSLLVGFITAALAAGFTPAVANATPALIYAAVGDSFSAGPASGYPSKDFTVYEQGTGTSGNQCYRSTTAYPLLVEKDKGLTLSNATCSGAVTTDVLHASTRTLSNGSVVTVPAQIDSVPSNAAVVPITIGGNDIGFGDFSACIVNTLIPNPVCTESSPQIVAARALLQTLRPKVANVIAAVQAKAPAAKVIITGYPKVVSSNGGGPGAPGCYPWLAQSEATLANDVEVELNSIIQLAAQSAGVTYVNPYDNGGFSNPYGTNACVVGPTQQINGILVEFPAGALHPNWKGMRSYADLVGAAI